MILGIIYISTCKINNKSYIDKTIQHLSNRKRRHKYDSLCNINTKFCRAIRKHGWNNFEWEILYDSIPVNSLNYTERLAILFYDTYNNGYNSTLGGEDNNMSDIESRNKISKTLKEYYLNKPNSMSGKIHTEKARKK